MRLALGMMVLGSVVPTAGMRACVDAPPPARLHTEIRTPRSARLLTPTEVTELRVGCFSDPTLAADADPLGDTEPVFGPAVAWDEACTAFGFRRDGALWSRSEGAAYAPGDTDLTLVFDEDRVGGVGVSFLRDPWRAEVVIRGVEAGAPADGVVVPGDRVLAVNEAPVRGGRWSFIDAVTGEPGTPVALTLLQRDGTLREVVLERASIPALR